MILMIIGFMLVLGDAGNFDLAMAQEMPTHTPIFAIIGVVLMAVGVLANKIRSERRR